MSHLSRNKRRCVAGLVGVMLASPVLAYGEAQAQGAPSWPVWSLADSFRTGSTALPWTPSTQQYNFSSWTNQACLTAAGGSASASIPACLPIQGGVDAAGAGALRLTTAGQDQMGAVFLNRPLPTAAGLDVTFTSHQYGGGGADGIALLFGVADGINVSIPKLSGGGGMFGYQPYGAVPGMDRAYLGVGVDSYGNFGGACCYRNALAVRGPGHGSRGYDLLRAAAPLPWSVRGQSREASQVNVEVVLNPTATSVDARQSAISVTANSYMVAAQPAGTKSWTVLTGPLPSRSQDNALADFGLDTAFDSDGLPRRLVLGLVGVTGGETDIHEIRDFAVTTVTTLTDPPKFAVALVDSVLTPGRSTYLSVANAQPGSAITISGSLKAAVTADQFGFALVPFSPAKTGVQGFTASYSVKVGKKTTKYTATTQLYVPSMSGPMLKIKPGKTGKFSMQFMPPGAAVSIALSDGRTLTGTADSAGKASFTPTFNTLGAVTYTASVAGVQIGTGGLTVTR